ncbi:acyl-CoA thioesterase [Suttonella sp. R2A3]|uniref:acyl-CoA thioesterase n=1 Tax=Suttonella sp. R2A3 TaxID=2908648 RepID=UPI001F21A1E4|nr:thioesterase family protein [Suttonella sp. R2A3]UJF24204.1 acyl-CoA thioesterase [Suttonella sp. R2A3]
MANTYRYAIKVRNDAIDVMGHVNNARYVSWMQDAAIAHWTHITEEIQRARYLWVAKRHEIDYLKPAFVDEQLICETWVSECHGALCLRHYRITRGDTLLLEAQSQWCMIDAQSNRVARIPGPISALFS